MNEGFTALQALLGRLSAFFDLFDLSFLVSGASSLAALFWLYKLRTVHGLPDWVMGPHGAVLLTLGAYLLGLLCFIVGRLLRRLLLRLLVGESFSRRFFRKIVAAIKEHEWSVLDSDPSLFSRYVRRLQSSSRPDPQAEAAAARLYALMWTQVRQQPELGPSNVLLHRYWVMTALCDGMSISCLFWLAVLLFSGPQVLDTPWLFRLGLALSGVGAVLFLREAERYAAVQIDDLFSTVAWERNRPLPRSAAPTDASPAAAPSPAASGQ